MAEVLACRESMTAGKIDAFEKLIAGLSDFVVFLIDPNACIVTWNPGVERVLGYTETEWIGQNVEVIFTPEDREVGAPQHEIDTALKEGRSDDTRWHVRKDGQRVFVEGALHALHHQNGSLIGFGKVFRDVTESRRDQQRLQDALDFANSIIATVREPMLILDAALTVHTANRSFLTSFQVTEEQTIGRMLHKLGNGQWNIPKLRTLLEEILPTQAVVNDFEVEHSFPEIGTRTMLLNARKLWREGNHSELVLLAIEDITSRKRVEAELKQSESRQAALADFGERIRHFHNADSVIDAGLELLADNLGVDRAGYGRIDLLNDSITVENCWTSDNVKPLDSFYRFSDFGHRLTEVLKSGSKIRIGDAHADPLTEGFEDRWKQVQVRGYLAAPMFRDGLLTGMFFLHQATPRIWTLEEQTFLRKVADRTLAAVEREAANAQRDRLTAELRRSNNELSEFAHLAAHDLQAPLRGVTSFMQLFRRTLPEEGNAAGEEYFRLALKSAGRMQTLIESLLHFAQVGQGEIETKPVSMEKAFEDTLEALQSHITEKQAIVSRTELPIVLGDGVLLRRLLQNLIGNALKYSRAGERPQVQVSAERQHDDFIFRITDNGEGIPPDQIGTIFEPFRRLHGAEVPGTGLGLATCRQIVERHGGHIGATSEQGSGSVFFFTLPIG